MSLDYSQKQLINSAMKGARSRGRISPMSKSRASFANKLPVYAFWTGFFSTIISLVQVVIISLKG